MPHLSHRPESCHNCRRQRLKCGNERPQCVKCIRRGQECLGYQSLLRWNQGVASRGKMAGMTFGNTAKNDESQTMLSSSLSSSTQAGSPDGVTPLPLEHFTDPLLQDLNYSSRRYLCYFANHVCRDFVLYDLPRHNPFREMVPLTHQNPVLLQIIVANSALHMSNAAQKSLMLGSPVSNSTTSLLGSPCLSTWTARPSEHYNDALTARQRALFLLRSMLPDLATVDVDITLAVVLLFIEFELIDSGRDNWRHHIRGAKTIIETVCRSSMSPQHTMSQLRSWLISNCLVFDILGSTLAGASNLSPETYPKGAISLLQDAEGNHCSSFPAALLHLMRSGAEFSRLNESNDFSQASMQQQAHELLNDAQAFDPLLWAMSVQSRSPAKDLRHRIHVASAHQAAVCIYLARVLASKCPAVQVSLDFESTVANIIEHLCFICPGDALFTATTWPTFIAGAETSDIGRQEWVARRFQELWQVEPWGLMKGALGVLERIWAVDPTVPGVERYRDVGGEPSHQKNWIEDLRGRGVDWLIL